MGNDAGSETKPALVVAGSGPLSNHHAMPLSRKSRRLTRFPAASNVAVAFAGAATVGGQTLALACVMERRSVGLPQFYQGMGTAHAGVAATKRHRISNRVRRRIPHLDESLREAIEPMVCTCPVVRTIFRDRKSVV